jgi:hypothetical protein
MAFPLEKILTVSAREYCESMGKKLKDYDMEGIHTRNSFGEEDGLTNLYDAFAGKVPQSAEIVVGYTVSAAIGGGGTTYTQCYASGTALIPRTNKNAIKDDNDLKRRN